MPLFLAGLLVRGGVLAPQVVEEALQRQVLAGGALDSSLLELGALEEPQLAEYLARASGLPLATPEQLASPDQRLRRLFPLRLAERHGLVPFAQEEKTLRMACAYPADAALLEEMGFLLSQRIEAWVAPEFRVRLAIERLYGQPASARMHELARRCGAEVAPRPADLPAAPPAPRDPERSVAPDWTVSEALARLESASNRDEAIDVALRFGRRHFSWVALFGLVGGKAIGWDAVGEEPGSERRVEQVVQPLDEETVFSTVVHTQGRYLGPVAPTEANLRLVERMGRQPPQTAFVHPVQVGDRTVALIWADNGAGEVPQVAAAETMVVMQALGHALERLIRGRKAAVAATSESVPAPAPVAAPAEIPAPVAVADPTATVAAPADVPTPVAVAESTAPVAAPAAVPAPAAEAPAQAETLLDTDESPAAGEPAPAADDATPPAKDAPAPVALAARAAAQLPPPGGAATALQQACAGVEALLAAGSDAERAAALARIAGSGAIGAELLVALLPGPLRIDGSGAVSGGAFLDALLALGPWAIPALTSAARSPSSSLRYWAAVLLAGSADTAAHAALARLASDRDPHVAAVARLAAQPAA
ncbi:hypothetical protein [Vulgatibacter sp.]|uniref:GspE/PulE/PilB domain-containing protein n=1 Tax=Vulgatibacter sp. TaxID=1971226 RepID=UPI0035634564